MSTLSRVDIKTEVPEVKIKTEDVGREDTLIPDDSISVAGEARDDPEHRDQPNAASIAENESDDSDNDSDEDQLADHTAPHGNGRTLRSGKRVTGEVGEPLIGKKRERTKKSANTAPKTEETYTVAGFYRPTRAAIRFAVDGGASQTSIAGFLETYPININRIYLNLSTLKDTLSKDKDFVDQAELNRIIQGSLEWGRANKEEKLKARTNQSRKKPTASGSRRKATPASATSRRQLPASGTRIPASRARTGDKPRPVAPTPITISENGSTYSPITQSPTRLPTPHNGGVGMRNSVISRNREHKEEGSARRNPLNTSSSRAVDKDNLEAFLFKIDKSTAFEKYMPLFEHNDITKVSDFYDVGSDPQLLPYRVDTLFGGRGTSRLADYSGEYMTRPRCMQLATALREHFDTYRTQEDWEKAKKT